MRYWLDTEFIEDGHTIDLISVGFVCEDGRELYAQLYEADHTKANQWVVENVLSQLTRCQYGPQPYHRTGRCFGAGIPGEECPWETRAQLAHRIRSFCDPEKYGKPEFWGYYADYDWVVLCQLYGAMVDLPKGWPMYCRDIKQWCDDLGNPELPPDGKNEHHALADARWNKSAWEFLEAREGRLWGG